MSWRRCLQVRCNDDVQWRNFVRESARNDLPRQHINQVEPQENDVKTAYEEIVGQRSDCIAAARLQNLRLKTSEKYKNVGAKPAFTNAQLQVNMGSGNKPTNVTVNALLKAVELKDWKFLREHVTSENVNIFDAFGWTLLMSAAYCGHLEIVQFLLNLGANVRARDRSGLTAAQLALKKNFLNVVALLKRKPKSISDNSQSSADLPEVKNADSLLAISNVKSVKYHDMDIRPFAEEEVKPRKTLRFYCKICKTTFHETVPQKHETSILHIFNAKPKLRQDLYGISKQNKGYKMLLSAGWDEEMGLGPAGKGMKYPVKTCLKMDRKGLGQPIESKYRVTHFKSGDVTAINNVKIPKQKCLKKKDREKLLHKEARKDRLLRIALS